LRTVSRPMWSSLETASSMPGISTCTTGQHVYTCAVTALMKPPTPCVGDDLLYFCHCTIHITCYPASQPPCVCNDRRYSSYCTVHMACSPARHSPCVCYGS
jgi:hypothetical protein